MKQRLEMLIPVGAIATVIAVTRPWSHIQTLQQLWQQRQQRIAAENVSPQPPDPPPIVQLGSIQGQVVYDANGNGQADQQRTVVYVESFENGVPVKAELVEAELVETESLDGQPSGAQGITAAWSNPQTKAVPIASDSPEEPTKNNQILGLFGGVSDGDQGATTLTLENLPPHQSVEVTVDVWIVDSWDGNIDATFAPDLWQLRQGPDQVLLRTSFSNIDSRAESQSYPLAYPDGNVDPRTNAVATNQLNQRFYGDSLYRLQHTFAHNDSQLSLNFSGQGKTALADDESWGLDNLQITLRSGEGGVEGALAKLVEAIAFLDHNRNGVRDEGEPFTQTDGDGNFQFQGLSPGDYQVGLTEPLFEGVPPENGEETNEGGRTPPQNVQIFAHQDVKPLTFLISP